MIDTRPTAAVVQRAEMSEHQIVEAINAANSQSAWEIGRLAHEWVQKWSIGRTYEDLAKQTPGLSSDQLRQRANVWERFGDEADSNPVLSWTHFYVAINWDDATECLQWANETGASVAEMKAWRRANRGEDLSQTAADEQTDTSGECRENARAPERANRNGSQATGEGVSRQSDSARESDEPGPLAVPRDDDEFRETQERPSVLKSTPREHGPKVVVDPPKEVKADWFRSVLPTIERIAELADELELVHRKALAHRLRALADELESEGE